MGFVKSYALPRLLQWAVVILIGTTVTFTIPRLLPTDPVEQTHWGSGRLRGLSRLRRV